MKLKKCLLLAIVGMSLTTTGIFAQGELIQKEPFKIINSQIKYSIKVNQKELENGKSVYLKDKSLMIPLRSVCESLGFEIKFNENTKLIDIYKGAQFTSIKISKNEYFFAKVAPFALSSEPELKDGVTFVPIDFFEKILKLNVNIDANNISISDKDSQEVKFETMDAKIKEVKPVRDYYFVLGETQKMGDVIFIVSEETKILDSKLNKITIKDLKSGDEVSIKHSLAMTMSLPPQTGAFEIKLKN